MKSHRSAVAFPSAAGVAGLAVVLLGLAATTSPARADADPPLTIIRDVLVCPDGSLPYTITLVGPTGPIPNALVEIRYTPAGEAAACWCPGQIHPIISATSNPSGIATFHIAAGGCLEPSSIPGGVVAEVWIDGVKAKEVGQVSPQVVSLPNCEVTLASSVLFTHYLATADYGYCYDLNRDGGVTLTDGVILTWSAAIAAHCN